MCMGVAVHVCVCVHVCSHARPCARESVRVLACVRVHVYLCMCLCVSAVHVGTRVRPCARKKKHTHTDPGILRSFVEVLGKFQCDAITLQQTRTHVKGVYTRAGERRA